MARFLFVEPFYGGSHQAFLDGLREHCGHDLELLTLPAGEWRQRMRRGTQQLADAASGLDGRFDGLVVTDMVDLPVFLALTRPKFDGVPILVYFHENQVTYPRLRGTKFNSWFGQVNYLSAVAADVVAFNSEFHRGDLLGALRTLAGQPNNWLEPANIRRIEAKSEVAPIGVDFSWLDDLEPPSIGPDPDPVPLVLWNHRWEFDKAPEMFARVVRKLADEGLAFRLALAGDPGPNPYPGLTELARDFADRLVHAGLATREEYGKLLWAADIVVSTARHEFFGVGMVEAMYCGCCPVAPARFNYPALVPPDLHEWCLYEDEAGFERLLRRAIEERPREPSLRESAGRFAWKEIGPLWRELFARVANT